MSTDYEDYARKHLKDVSPEGLRAFVLICEWRGGIHHFPGGDRAITKTRWNDFFVRLRLQESLSTFDGDSLTRLVLLAHDHGIRVDVSPSMRCLELLFHPRRTRIGGFSARHPTMEQALAQHRRHYPVADRLAGVDDKPATGATGAAGAAQGG